MIATPALRARAHRGDRLAPGSRRTPPAAADDAAALLAKHEAYAGWQAGDGVVESLRESGTVTRDGAARNDRCRCATASCFATRYTRDDGGTFEDGFTGSASWSSNAERVHGPDDRRVARVAYTEDALFGEYTAPRRSRRPFVRNETIDGAGDAVVRLTSAVGFPPTRRRSRDRHASARCSIRTESMRRVTTSSATRSSGGKARHVVVALHRLEGVHAYTTIEANKPVTDDELHPPKQTATWTFGDAPCASSTVELTHRASSSTQR